MFVATAKVEYHTNWIIAKCDPELLDYYRTWVWRRTGLWLNKPLNGAHISIVRGNIESGQWDRNMDGETIRFFYNGNLECHWNYVWLPVYGKDLSDIRQKVGLDRKPKKAFHMSVGMLGMDFRHIMERGFC